MGFHVDHTNDELAETSLRWWLSDRERVVGDELFAVTVATFPVAVYRGITVAPESRRESRAARTPRPDPVCP
jgi:hypothetical protein